MATVAHRGRGIASSALTALTAFAWTPALYRAGLYIEPWNSSSIHVAEASGYQREGLLRSHQEIGGTRRDMLLYATTDPDRFACMTGRSRGSGMQLRSLREQPVVVHRAGQPKGGQRITRRFPAIA